MSKHDTKWDRTYDIFFAGAVFILSHFPFATCSRSFSNFTKKVLHTISVLTVTSFCRCTKMKWCCWMTVHGVVIKQQRKTHNRYYRLWRMTQFAKRIRATELFVSKRKWQNQNRCTRKWHLSEVGIDGKWKWPFFSHLCRRCRVVCFRTFFQFQNLWHCLVH